MASWSFTLCDIKTDTLIADITSATLSATVSPRLNRPLSMQLTLPADTASIRAAAFDGDRSLVIGTRCIKAYRGGILKGNVIVWNLEYTGDQDQAQVVITGYDPAQRFQTRMVYDGSGNIGDPSFASPISGAEIILDVIENSVTYDDAIVGGVTPAKFPIDTATGAFDVTIPPAVDLSSQLSDGPTTVATLYSLLSSTGAVDIVLAPVDTSFGFAAGIMAQLNAYNQFGTDKTASVNLDYATGDHSISQIRRTFDMDAMRNKIRYLLGPKQDLTHWAGSIDATETTPVNLSAYLALELASRQKYGAYTVDSIYDSDGSENTVRTLFHTLFEADVQTGVNGRELLYVTPSTAAPFLPFADYYLGDLISVNTSDLVGPALVSAPQRVYGFDVTVDADGVETVGALICSSDAE